LNCYADSSFFVSLYLTDRHSAEVKRRMAQRPSLWLTPLHRAEWTSAIAQHCFRGSLSEQGARKGYDAFDLHRASGLWTEVAWPEAAFDLSVRLSRVHAPVVGARALDTLHVAAAMELGAKEFWTFDDRQAKLAVAVGLKVV